MMPLPAVRRCSSSFEFQRIGFLGLANFSGFSCNKFLGSNWSEPLWIQSCQEMWVESCFKSSSIYIKSLLNQYIPSFYVSPEWLESVFFLGFQPCRSPIETTNSRLFGHSGSCRPTPTAAATPTAETRRIGGARWVFWAKKIESASVIPSP